MTTTRIKMTNDFHRTRVSLLANDGLLSAGQVRRAQRALCGMADCDCGDSLGRRGPQPTGSPDVMVWRLRDTGQMIGAVVQSTPNITGSALAATVDLTPGGIA